MSYIKDWFGLRREDYKGLFVLVVIIAVSCLILFFLPKKEKKSRVSKITKEQLDELKRFDEEVRKDSLAQEKRWKKKNVMELKNLRRFNPNTLDSLSFVSMGFPSWMIRNIMRYRRKNGLWRSAEHFSKLYGLKREDFERLKPYICIEYGERIAVKDSTRVQRERLWKAKRKKYPEKYKQKVCLDLNTVDTLALKKIPGIGSYYSRKIVRYRQRLGGFVCTSQLREIEDLPDSIETWFVVSDTLKVRKLQINKASFKELVRHPYISYEQTKEIVNFRRKFGPIRSWKDLSLSKVFTPEHFERLTPYVDFRW